MPTVLCTVMVSNGIVGLAPLVTLSNMVFTQEPTNILKVDNTNKPSQTKSGGGLNQFLTKNSLLLKLSKSKTVKRSRLKLRKVVSLYAHKTPFQNLGNITERTL